MKMIFAGVSSSPLPSESFRYNCILNTRCQKKWYIPVKDLCFIDLFTDLPFMPTSYTLTLVDVCTGTDVAIVSNKYVVGESTDGYYGVFSDLIAAGLTTLPDIFYIRAEFFLGTDIATFYTNDYSPLECFNLTEIQACYNDATIGSQAYDINGIYYGYPTTNIFLGDKNWRYYHTALVRLAKVTNTKHKVSFTMFNNNYAYRAKTNKLYNFQSEVVPEFYKDVILGIATRGMITIDGKPYSLSGEIDLSVHTEESELWEMDLPLEENIDTYFSCKATECNFERCVPLPPCCSPEDVVAAFSTGCDNITNLDFTFRQICNDDNCNHQGDPDFEFWFTNPTPFEIRLAIGMIEENTNFSPSQFNGFGYNGMYALPPGVNVDGYYAAPGDPFTLIIPAGVTHYVYVGETYTHSQGTSTGVFQVGQGPANFNGRNCMICQHCMFPVRHWYLKALTDCVALQTVTDTNNIPVTIVN